MDEYLVIACDGIWDVMSNEECGKFIKEEVARGVPNTGLVRGSLFSTVQVSLTFRMLPVSFSVRIVPCLLV